jgi:hypothetical protein
MNDAYLRLLDVAKSLTGSSDIDVLIEAANKIAEAMGTDLRLMDQISNYVETGRVFGTLADFLKLCPIQHPQQGMIPFTPYPFQEKIAEKLGEQKITLVNHGRQMGITTLLAGFSLYTAVELNDQAILIVDRNFNSGMELLQRIYFMYDNTKMLLPKLTVRNKSEMHFDNGSKIMVRACNGHAARGLSLTHLIIDQAAYISHKIGNEFMQSVYPTLATGGKLIMSSTPGDCEGIFFDTWHNTDLVAERIHTTWRDHPHRDEAWANGYRSQLGEMRFRKEFDAEFVKPV